MERDGFESWFAASSARLHHALVATYGPVDGRAAAIDALGYAWEHWDRVRQIANPMGYLYRVGQSAVRRHRNRPIPLDGRPVTSVDSSEVDADLHDALAMLTDQQRTVVVMVHAYGWSVRAAAELLDLAPSTVQTHLERAMTRLRAEMEHSDAH